MEIKNSLAMAFEDKYPITEDHMLVSPLRHMPSFFDLGCFGTVGLFFAVGASKGERIMHTDSTVTGFDLGIMKVSI